MMYFHFLNLKQGDAKFGFLYFRVAPRKNIFNIALKKEFPQIVLHYILILTIPILFMYSCK